MKLKKLLIAIGIIILLTIPLRVSAASNDFTATLSVSDTHVTSGTTITGTIIITNTDNTYGADVAVSYGAQVISSFYLSAGQTKTIYHNVTISKTTDVYYTVHASHGPDISESKDTNTVTVYVVQPSTATPKPTNTATFTPNITPEITVTPYVTQEEADDIREDNQGNLGLSTDENTGWGTPILQPKKEQEVFDNLFRENIIKWLGLNSDKVNNVTKEVYNIRRLLTTVFLLIIVVIAVFIIILIRRGKIE